MDERKTRNSVARIIGDDNLWFLQDALERSHYSHGIEVHPRRLQKDWEAFKIGIKPGSYGLPDQGRSFSPTEPELIDFFESRNVLSKLYHNRKVITQNRKFF